MTELIALILALSALLPQAELRQEPVHFVDIYGVERRELGAMSCVAGETPIVWIAPSASFQTAVEEMLHLYDCLDNGLLDGSPLPAGAVMDWRGDPSTALARLHTMHYRRHPAEAWAEWALRNPAAAREIVQMRLASLERD